jgi:hypothetical protein
MYLLCNPTHKLEFSDHRPKTTNQMQKRYHTLQASLYVLVRYQPHHRRIKESLKDQSTRSSPIDSAVTAILSACTVHFHLKRASMNLLSPKISKPLWAQDKESTQYNQSNPPVLLVNENNVYAFLHSLSLWCMHNSSVAQTEICALKMHLLIREQQ